MYFFKVPYEYEIYLLKEWDLFFALQLYSFYMFCTSLMMTLIGWNMWCFIVNIKLVVLTVIVIHFIFQSWHATGCTPLSRKYFWIRVININKINKEAYSHVMYKFSILWAILENFHKFWFGFKVQKWAIRLKWHFLYDCRLDSTSTSFS